MKIKPIIATSLTCAMLAGCASTPDNAGEVTELRNEYKSMSANPDVVRHAPSTLRQAEIAIRKAEAAVADGEDEQVIDHLAYIAEKRLDIAQAKLEESQARQEIKNSEIKRKDLLVKKHQREAQDAKAAAATAAAAAQSLASEAARLQSELENVKAKSSERGLVLTLSDILFDTDKATLAPGNDRTLNKIADFLKQHDDKTIVIEGHTDSRGAESYNENLSMRRADAVFQALIDRGVERKKLIKRGLGEAYPVASNDTASGRQQNRRVEIIIENDEQGYASNKR